MAKQTKIIIMQSFMRLLNRLPFDKISVKDIVEDSGINRNTFYYNFKDIYDLVDEILQNEVKKIAEQHKNPYASWREGLLSGADFALKNKKAIYHLYNSVKKPQLEKYFEHVIYDIVLEFTKEKASGTNADENDISFIAYFYCCALRGIINKWLDGGMQESFDEIIDKTGFLFDSNLKQAIKLISEKAKN